MHAMSLRVYPGGLEAVNDLEVVSVPPIITKMVHSKLSTKRFKCKLEKQMAQYILSQLKSSPNTLEEYVTRLRQYNFLSWINTKVESQRNISGPCILEPVTHRASPRMYRVEVNQAFCVKNGVKDGTLLSLYPRIPGQIVEVIYAKVVRVDSGKRCIYITTTDKISAIICSEPCRLGLATSCFNFLSRNRVLTTIAAGNLENIVFPQLPKDMISVDKSLRQEDKDLARIKFSPNTNLNRLQKVAIIGMIRASPSLPYLLFGPPGTGKTTTLVEATVQLLKDSPDNKILVCTPSNAAADLFTLALLKTGALEKSSILRMFSMSKPVNEQNPDLKDVVCVVLASQGRRKDDCYYCYYYCDDSQMFGFEPKEEMEKKYSVIVSTLSACSYLVSGGLKGVFSHIIVDEAGQADELDTLIPIVGLANENTRVVLAGDPNQLGPVEPIEWLKPFGLNTSLLERFIKMSCYKCDRVMTMLRNNYRSHALLVETPSKLFYDGLLIASAEESQKNTLCQWSGLPTKGVPIIFHSVCNVEQREKYGSSCRNLREANLLKDYVNRILKETNVAPKEIGIISPYKYQTPLQKSDPEIEEIQLKDGEVNPVNRKRNRHNDTAKKLEAINWVNKSSVKSAAKKLVNIWKKKEGDLNRQVKMLRKKFSKFPEMLIDSVERFQGSERRVILISTVRNKGLGFLDCDKRLNTTITRAQELMIVVGNHENLSQSRSWKKMIEFCKSKSVLIYDLESPLKAVRKKPGRGKKCRQALVESDQMDMDDRADVPSSNKGQTSGALNVTARKNKLKKGEEAGVAKKKKEKKKKKKKEVKGIEDSLRLLTLNNGSGDIGNS